MREKINDNNYSGKWTMVYDEGFNIDTEEWTFFAFSKYSPAIMKNGKYNFQSYCYRTCIGWYSNKDGSLWGCYYGYKKGTKTGTVFEKSTKVETVVEPTKEEVEVKKNLKLSEDKQEKKKDEVHFTSHVTYKTPEDTNNKENKENKENLQILRVRITTYNLKKMKLSINKKVYIYIRSVSIDRQAYQYD
jgi:hypothetical protein